MTPEFTVYVEATPQIRELLENLGTDIDYTVSCRWPRKKIDGNLITVTEITNIQTTISVVDQLAWQVDLWSPDADIVRGLVPMVNEALCGLGLRREYSGPLDYERTTDGGYFRQTFRYGRNVDKRSMRLID